MTTLLSVESFGVVEVVAAVMGCKADPETEASRQGLNLLAR